jgi:trimeric autotransporter adhesin
MKKICTFISILFLAANAWAQNVGINNTNPQVSLDVNGGFATRATTLTIFSNAVNIPANASFINITGSATANISCLSPNPFVNGQRLIIYNNNSGAFDAIFFGNSIPYGQAREFICRAPGGWSLTSTAQANAWNLTGNTGITNSNFIGTINDAPLLFKINGGEAGGIGRYGNVSLGSSRTNDFFNDFASAGSSQNTAIGNTALRNYAVMYANTAVGFGASENNLGGSYNASLGHYAMRNNRSGDYAVAIGKDALLNDTAAHQTVAIGANALYWNNNKFGNTAVGTNSLFNNSFGTTTATQGIHNTALGHSALFSNRRGSGAVAIGYNALYSDTLAEGNIAIGRAALYNNNGRDGNIAIGDSALFNNAPLVSLPVNNAKNNIAIGERSLFSNTTGYNNTALGYRTLLNNINGSVNVAIGTEALTKSIGSRNVAVGNRALASNVLGVESVAVGNQALESNTGNYNTAIGQAAITGIGNGSHNTALGSGALFGGGGSGSNNVAIGSSAGLFNNGSGNILIGRQAGTSDFSSTNDKLFIENSNADKDNALIYGDFAADSLQLNAKILIRDKLGVKGAGGNSGIELGYGIAGKEANAGRIGYGLFTSNAIDFVGGGTTVTPRLIKFWAEGGSTFTGKVIPDGDNQHSLGQSGNRWSTVWAANGTIQTSDARLKTNITTSPYGLEQVLQMNPVQYNWKENPNADLQIGFLAQDIQKIIPEAVVVPTNGDPMGMKYTELIPVLVKGMQEQQKMIEAQQKKIAELENLIKSSKSK